MAMAHGRMIHRVNSEGLRRHAIAQATARQNGLSSLVLLACQRLRWEKQALSRGKVTGLAALHTSASVEADPRIAPFRGAHAALRPHSSAVLYTHSVGYVAMWGRDSIA